MTEIFLIPIIKALISKMAKKDCKHAHSHDSEAQSYDYQSLFANVLIRYTGQFAVLPGHLVCITETIREKIKQKIQQLLFLFKGNLVAVSGNLLAQQREAYQCLFMGKNLLMMNDTLRYSHILPHIREPQKKHRQENNTRIFKSRK